MIDYTIPGRPEGEWRNPKLFSINKFLIGSDQVFASVTEAAWSEGTEEDRDVYAGWWT